MLFKPNNVFFLFVNKYEWTLLDLNIMADSWTFLLLLCLFVFTKNSCGLSDFKICGDPECQMLMSRVLATRDHPAKDCRFLSFKKGDVLFVYYKLSGKRDDLWAGSKNRHFGYFLRDAVMVDEIHVKKEKEITLPTQKHDFFCIDENGMIIDSNELEDVHPENKDFTPTEVIHTTTEAIIQHTEINKDAKNEDHREMVPQDISDKNIPEPTAQGGSSWIGSAVTGLFGLGDKNTDDSFDNANQLEENVAQESFRSRKLALDIDGSKMEEPKQNEMFGWIGSELTSALGFGQKQPSTSEVAEKGGTDEKHPAEYIDTYTIYSHSWLNIGLEDVLNFGQGKEMEQSKNKNSPLGENIDSVVKSPESSQSQNPEAQTQETESNADKMILEKKEDSGCKEVSENGLRGNSEH
uniref:SH3 domain-containing protein n=1 Tax=Denticeps clupeoides TaxID=299321 RepID=A0AAY4B9Y8_9TELE